MIRKGALILVLFTLFINSYSIIKADEITIDNKLIFSIKDTTLTSVNIELNNLPAYNNSHTQIFFIALPFAGQNVQSTDKSVILGISQQEQYSIVTAIMPPNKHNLSFNCEINNHILGNEQSAQITETPFGVEFTVPAEINPVNLNLDLIKQQNGYLISKITNVELKTPSGYTFLDDASSSTSNRFINRPLNYIDNREKYQILFSVSDSSRWNTFSDPAFISVIVTCLMALIGAGILPTKAQKWFLISLFSLVIFIVSFSWVRCLFFSGQTYIAIVNSLIAVAPVTIILFFFFFKRSESKREGTSVNQEP